MKLYYSARSPFARRVRLALRRLGVSFEETLVDVFHPPADFLAANPLGLVPVLTTENPETGKSIHLPDSALILEYLHLKVRPLWDGLETRRKSELVAGVMTQTVAAYLERTKKSPDEDWARDYEESIQRTLSAIEAEVDAGFQTQDSILTQAGWDLGVALQYLDLRLPRLPWRTQWKKLEPFLLACSKDSHFQETVPPA